MTVLPILSRELQVRARSLAHHWGRFAVGALGLAIALPPLIWSGPFAGPTAVGRGAFDGLVSGAFLLCCAACFLTADTISSERREGTLGLLLLTRVRDFEVLLAKFVSSGLASVLGLMAFLPVLMLPILAGGVTGGEAARKGLALFGTLLLSLSAGLFASARGGERFQTTRTAVLVVAGIMLIPAALVPAVGYKPIVLASPLGAIFKAADSAYKISPSPYWLSVGLVHLIALTLLAGALICLRRRFQSEREATASIAMPKGSESVDDSARNSDHVVGSPVLTAALPQRCTYCGRHNDLSAIYCLGCGTELRPRVVPETPRSMPSDAPTPLHWLLRRRRGLRPMLWLAAAIACLQHLLFGFTSRFFGAGVGMFLGVSYAVGFAVLVVTSSIFVWAASRFFVEARRTGELEMLMTAPLGVEAILSTQWSHLKGLLAGPLILMLLPTLLQCLMLFSAGYVERFFFAGSLVLYALHTVLRVGALCWVGLWFGFRAGTQARAIFGTLMLVEAPSYVLSLTCSLLFRGLVQVAGSAWFSPWLLTSILPELVTLLFLFSLIRLARRQLPREMAGAESLSLQQLFANSWPRVAASVRKARQWRPVQPSE